MVLGIGRQNGVSAASAPALAMPKARPAFLENLSIGAFRHLLLSNGLSLMGKNVQGMAVAWLVLEMTESNLWVGIVNGVPAIAIVLFSLLGGVLADRMDRHTLLIWSRLTLTGLSFLVGLLIATGSIDLWQLMVLVTLIMGVHAVDEPVGRTMMLGIVGKSRLLSANSMTTLARNLGMVAAPWVMGLLMGRHGVDAALYLLAGTYLVAFAVMYLVPKDGTKSSGNYRMLQDLRDGFAYIRSNPRLSWLVSLSATVPLAGVFFGILPVYSRNVLGDGPETLGLLVAAYSMGGVIGSLYQMLTGRVHRQGLMGLATGIVYGMGMLGVAFSQSLPVTVIFTFTIGMAATLWLNAMSTMVQLYSAKPMQGRVMSIFGLGVQLYALGWLIGSVLAAAFGIQGALILSGSIFAAYHIFAFIKSSELRSVE